MVRPIRTLAMLVLALWLIGGLVLTLQPAYPLPGQVVDDNLVPFHTLGIQPVLLLPTADLSHQWTTEFT